MSASADLHELVRTTALILRRGLRVAVLGAANIAVLGGVIFTLAAFAARPRLREDDWLGGAFVFVATLAAVCTPALSLGVGVASFVRSLEGEPRLGDAVASALRRWPDLVALSLLALSPLVFLAVGCGLLAGAFTLTGGLALLMGASAVGLLTLGAWLLGWGVLLNAPALIVTHRFHDIRGHNALVLAVGATPLVPLAAFLGPALVPIVTLPVSVGSLVVVLALPVVALVASAVSVAGWAVVNARPAREDAAPAFMGHPLANPQEGEPS